jgi:hypothetical protein
MAQDAQGFEKNHQIRHCEFNGIGDPISVDHQASPGRAGHSVTSICQSTSIGYKFYHRYVRSRLLDAYQLSTSRRTCGLITGPT